MRVEQFTIIVVVFVVLMRCSHASALYRRASTASSFVCSCFASQSGLQEICNLLELFIFIAVGTRQFEVAQLASQQRVSMGVPAVGEFLSYFLAWATTRCGMGNEVRGHGRTDTPRTRTHAPSLPFFCTRRTIPSNCFI